MLLVKIPKYIGVCVYLRSYLVFNMVPRNSNSIILLYGYGGARVWYDSPPLCCSSPKSRPTIVKKSRLQPAERELLAVADAAVATFYPLYCDRVNRV